MAVSLADETLHFVSCCRSPLGSLNKGNGYGHQYFNCLLENFSTGVARIAAPVVPCIPVLHECNLDVELELRDAYVQALGSSGSRGSLDPVINTECLHQDLRERQYELVRDSKMEYLVIRSHYVMRRNRQAS